MKRIEYLKVALILPGNVLITIPVFIYLLTRDFYSYTLIRPYNPLFYVGMVFLALGLVLSIWAVRTFYNKGGDGTPGPWRPVSNLVIEGPYRYVRNPMILGVVNLLLFESVFFESFPLLLWTILFFLGNLIYFKFFEEKELVKRFGGDYLHYKEHVSMLFPKVSSYRKKL
ncbi:MAG: isoprenylcysteine carboxylmethyltransferase family protein [Candidatus Neomarinimicrobiota bacterium]|nr:isoprenylcysteine carboxylmethyltransferase family protein [Candidatus Neomarinimicrobiota bacterium]